MYSKIQGHLLHDIEPMLFPALVGSRHAILYIFNPLQFLILWCICFFVVSKWNWPDINHIYQNMSAKVPQNMDKCVGRKVSRHLRSQRNCFSHIPGEFIWRLQSKLGCFCRGLIPYIHRMTSKELHILIYSKLREKVPLLTFRPINLDVVRHV